MGDRFLAAVKPADGIRLPWSSYGTTYASVWHSLTTPAQSGSYTPYIATTLGCIYRHALARSLHMNKLSFADDPLSAS